MLFFRFHKALSCQWIQCWWSKQHWSDWLFSWVKNMQWLAKFSGQGSSPNGRSLQPDTANALWWSWRDWWWNDLQEWVLLPQRKHLGSGRNISMSLCFHVSMSLCFYVSMSLYLPVLCLSSLSLPNQTWP